MDSGSGVEGRGMFWSDLKNSEGDLFGPGIQGRGLPYVFQLLGKRKRILLGSASSTTGQGLREGPAGPTALPPTLKSDGGTEKMRPRSSTKGRKQIQKKMDNPPEDNETNELP